MRASSLRSAPKSTDNMERAITLSSSESHRPTRRDLQLSVVVLLALMQIAVLCAFMSGNAVNSFVTHTAGTLVSITYTEEFLQDIKDVQMPAGRDIGRAGFAKSGAGAEPEYPGHMQSRAAAARAAGRTPGGQTSCMLAALEEAPRPRKGEQSRAMFKEPLVSVPHAGVVLTSYFTTRVHPTSCGEYPDGHPPVDEFDYIQEWYASVDALALPAVVLHDGLSPSFVGQVQTSNIQFQKVQLQRRGWSLPEERWAVYAEWLRSPGAAQVRYVLAMDSASAVVSRDPFPLFEKWSAEWGLWVGVQRNTSHRQAEHKRCYPRAGPLPVPQASPSMVLSPGALGGTTTAVLTLADAMVAELELLQRQQSDSKAAWNCAEPALQRVLSAGGDTPLANIRINAAGWPFCGTSSQCFAHGVCDMYLYQH